MPRPLAQLQGKNFRLALVTFFAVCGILAILPFGLWRLSEGQWLVGVLDLLIVLSLAGALVAARYYKRVDDGARVMVVLTTIACLVLAPVNGQLIVFWGFPVLVSNLLLAGRSFGLVANVCLIVGLTLTAGLHASTVEQVTFAITASLLSLYAYLFAVMTDSQRDKLKSLATFDELTGAGNRRMMQLDLTERFAQAKRHKLPHAIAVIDLDYFKAVNDTYGHEAGDAVLKQFVALAQEVARADDRLYRMGGEEFVMFLPHTGHVGLLAFLDRLQAHLRPSLTGPGGPVTVSIGAAVMQDSDPDWMAWLARADRAMYRAKNEGRDRLCIAPGGWVEAGGEDLEKDAA